MAPAGGIRDPLGTCSSLNLYLQDKSQINAFLFFFESMFWGLIKSDLAKNVVNKI